MPRKVLLDHYVSNILEDETLNLNYDSEVVENAEDTFREDPYPGTPNLAVAGRSHNTSNLVISSTNWSGTVSSKDNTKPGKFNNLYKRILKNLRGLYFAIKYFKFTRT